MGLKTSAKPSANAERLKKYKARMRAAGFSPLSVWVCPELVKMLAMERRPAECRGRVLERLLLGEARMRPEFWAKEEPLAKGKQASKRLKRAACS